MSPSLQDLQLLKSPPSPPANPKTLGKLWTSSPSQGPSRTRAPLLQAGFSNTQCCAKRPDTTHGTVGESVLSMLPERGTPGDHVPRVFPPHPTQTSTRLTAVLSARAHAGSVLAQVEATNNSPLQQSVAMSGSLTT